jgi:CRISPR-associated protein Cas1
MASPLADDATMPVTTNPTHSVIHYNGNLEVDGAAWKAVGERYYSKASHLLSHSALLVLAGYGPGINLEHDALVVREGRTHWPQDLPVHTLYRGQRGIRRIIVTNSTGSVSLPAIEWCRDQGISILVLGYDGRVHSAIGADVPADARLRRAQNMAASRGRDVEIGRAILDKKIAGQLRTLQAHPELHDTGRVEGLLKAARAWLALKEPPPCLATIPSLQLYEAKLATLYFGTMCNLPLRWLKSDRKRIPPHWLVAGPCLSPISGGKNARHASSPFHCVLNYAYGVLEGSCRLALSSLGFDLSAAFLHADSDGPDSLVFDLVELDRPTVDGLVIDVLTKWILHYGDFTRVRDGSVKLHPQLARAVVAACRVEQRVLDRHAAWLAQLVVEGASDEH